MARRRFLAGYEVDLRAALESAGVQGKAISRGRLYSDRDSEARLRGDGSGCNAFNLSNSRANLGVGRHRKNRISRRGDCIFCFGIYTGIYRANESLISSHKPSLYCPPTIFVADGPNLIDILESFVNRFPAFKQQPVGVVILDALLSVFPCQQ